MKELTIRHTGKIKAGKLTLDNRDLFLFDLESFEGEDIELVIKGIKNTRSNRMNRYYWSVIIKALTDYFNKEQTFNRKIHAENVHEIMKLKFLGTMVWDLPNGDVMESVESSKELTNKEFISYFENIIAWSAEMFGLVIPLPNEAELLSIDVKDKNKYIG